MLPGPMIIRECRNCGGEYSERTLMSGNTMGSMVWSDGLMIAPMLPEKDYLIRCPHCKNLTWIEDERIVRKLEFHDPDFDQLNREEFINPEREDFLTALTNEEINKDSERERYLRTKWWHFSNSKFRGGKNLDLKFTADETENLLKLVQLLNDNSDEDSIMIAEIYRELGQFDKCIQLLDRDFSEDYKTTVDKIRSKAEEEDSHVFQL